ncbi:MAG TPA: DUF1328 domain-containing protein [Syntrophales bacterium]|nr:DUF1328 domain-containing protein [Syntrophales bacterium]
MIAWAFIFFIIALVAAVLGFTTLAIGAAASIAQILFFVFLVLFVASLILRYTKRRPPPAA